MNQVNLAARSHPGDPSGFLDRSVLNTFDELRSNDPVHLSEDSPYGPYWSITRYGDIKEVDMAHEVFSSDAYLGGIVIEDAIFGDPNSEHFIANFITMDPPHHAPQRKAVANIVRPESLQNFETIIRGRTQRILDDLPVGEPFNWVPKVSIELTTQMLATLFDFPFEDRHKLTRWSDMATAEPGSPLVENQEQRFAELFECLDYFKRLREQRRSGPASFDLLTMMARDAATKEQPDHEFLGNLLLLIVGGNDTTRNSMSGSILAFHQFPQELEKLKANPKLLGSAVSEVIRWQTPLAHMRRTAKVDYELGGKTIKAGDKVVMWYYSGNYDGEAFDEPYAFKVDRPNVRQHLSFGFGIHRCLGMRLGELQLRILWEEILARWSHIEVLEEPTRVHSNFVNGYTDMMVKIHAKAD